MATLTISDAARRCGVARRTLQHALYTDRLARTPDHRVPLAALQQAGYVPATATQGHVAATPQRQGGTSQAMTQELSQILSPVVERLDRVRALLEAMDHTLDYQPAAATDRSGYERELVRRSTVLLEQSVGQIDTRPGDA